MNRRYSVCLICLMIGLGLGACSSSRFSERVVYIERPVELLYNNAADQLAQKDYADAILLFDEVERQHPYSEWASRAILMTAYSHYASNEYIEAVESATRYLSLHPGSDSAAYAYFLIAVCYFEQIIDVGRDQRTTEQALTALKDVVGRFPNTEYAADARLKIDMVNDQLAGKEMAVGRWYLRQDYHLAAINRFKRVIDVFQTTSHRTEALYRLVEAYLAIGLRTEALRTAEILGLNHPNSEWYKDAYSLLEDTDSLTYPSPEKL